MGFAMRIVLGHRHVGKHSLIVLEIDVILVIIKNLRLFPLSDRGVSQEVVSDLDDAVVVANAGNSISLVAIRSGYF